MFAVIKTGGKQYKVQAGDILHVEKLAAESGDIVQFNEILMVGAKVGTPVVVDAGVQAEVIDHIKGDKVINFVKRRRKHKSKRTKGHRQQLTLVKITEVLEKGADKLGVKVAMGAAAKTESPAAACGDDLTTITGVGPTAAKKLVDAGITTFAQLAAVDVDSFDAVNVKADWVEQAKTLA